MEKQSGKSEPIGIKAGLDAAQVGDFELLLRDEADAWWNFVIERIQLGTDELMLRMEIPSTDPWCLWLLYEVVDRSENSIALLQLMFPSEESGREVSFVTPQGYEQVPSFACRWPS